jgi:hypothetical protein
LNNPISVSSNRCSESAFADCETLACSPDDVASTGAGSSTRFRVSPQPERTSKHSGTAGSANLIVIVFQELDFAVPRLPSSIGLRQLFLC